jgi:nicotinate-nucleotide pyrophosphorylase (carboxylating)
MMTFPVSFASAFPASVSDDVIPAGPAIRAIVENALLEDLAQGDVTTDNLPGLAALAKTASIRVRERCVVSGLPVAMLCFRGVDPALRFSPLAREGDRLEAGSRIATVEGRMASILRAERTALNFLQHLCGVATMTRRYADAIREVVPETRTRITHTRKTTPGLRLLERQAVLHGGGAPHRFNLGACVMLKDNHLQALDAAGSAASNGISGEKDALAAAVRELRGWLSHTMRIEVEADRLEQVRQAVEAGADIVLLDNMSPAQIREALALVGGRAITEASGGISLETVRDYAATGVDYISTSAITLGAPAIDIGLDLD